MSRIKRGMGRIWGVMLLIEEIRKLVEMRSGIVGNGIERGLMGVVVVGKVGEIGRRKRKVGLWLMSGFMKMLRLVIWGYGLF